MEVIPKSSSEVATFERYYLTTDELARWCAEYDAWLEGEDRLPGFNVLHFIMNKIVGKTHTEEEMEAFYKQYSPEANRLAQIERLKNLEKHRDEQEKLYDDPKYRENFIKGFVETWGHKADKWSWETEEWYLERKRKQHENNS